MPDGDNHIQPLIFCLSPYLIWVLGSQTWNFDENFNLHVKSLLKFQFISMMFQLMSKNVGLKQRIFVRNISAYV